MDVLKKNTTSTPGVRFHPIQKIARLDILDGAPMGAWSLKPFIIFYRNQVRNCDMDQLENCNIQSYKGLMFKRH